MTSEVTQENEVGSIAGRGGKIEQRSLGYLQSIVQIEAPT